MKAWLVLLTWSLCAVVQAQPLPSAPAPAPAPAPDAGTPQRIAAERQQLQAQRNDVEQAHELRSRECWQRFAVNDCLREVRRSRRAALDPLRAWELELNAQERAWQTFQREERLRQKDDAQERKP
jgi:small-conductance mechanosensitive channel